MFKNVKIVSALIILFFLLYSCSHNSNELHKTESVQFDNSSQNSEQISENRMIAYSASLGLYVEDIEDTRKTLAEQVKNSNGFIVTETESHITARIPFENMNNFINNAKTLGDTKNETKTGTDITDQYRDDVIRLENLKNVRNRYLTLLEKANAVSDILNIERELERVNIEIEILEGRIKYAEQSVTYSNITVNFQKKTKPGPIGWIFYGLYRGIKWLFVWN